ncbi:gp081 [Rhodococcus phage ReqiPoco6]|uniref:Gp081 n=1 Tax=Rhodococcus phage ReqiPoco6 TaxID=691964 RepID=D4P7U9_9CAUD|nr:gp081 [Rhodococcus phage ReqiPoco6]ADD81079.1 gp081 [Rhodococcus phage ReqiPoco6]
MPAAKTTRLNKLYFEPIAIHSEEIKNLKPGVNKIRWEWNLRGTNGHVIGASHISFATKLAAVKNCLSVMGTEAFSEGRVNVVSPEMHTMILDEIAKL